MFPWNWGKLKGISWRGIFNSTLKKHGFFSISIENLSLFFFFFPRLCFRLCISMLYCSEKSIFKQKISTWIAQKRSNFHEDNMSPQHTLNFDQWKTISRIYKPIRFWLWFVYKNTEKNYRSFKSQKRYFVCSDKIKVLT